MRRAVYDMMNWWMDRGIDGFRMDVITQISKTYDANGKLPGEDGSLIEDYPVGEEGYSSPFPWCSDGPRVDEYLQEMRREVFAGRDGFITVGEAPGVDAVRNGVITDPKNGELDMLFVFTHMDVDCDGTKWNPVPLKLTALKQTLGDQQRAVCKAGWTSLFFCNHDQPRVASRWGDESPRSAKAIGLLLHMHRGTPYIYQGEELGMTNAHFTRLDQYRDLETLNSYRQRVEEAKVQTAESIMDAFAKRSRDNSRTPMQWDDSAYAGFMDADAAAEPWISVNPNHDAINAAAEVNDPDSVYAFYRRLIALRHEDSVVAAGDWELVDADSEQVYAFTRTLGGERLLVMVNMTADETAVPAESAALLPADPTADAVVIGTYDAPAGDGYDAAHAVASLTAGTLAPWEGIVVRI